MILYVTWAAGVLICTGFVGILCALLDREAL
jgi:hypothetical protein